MSLTRPSYPGVRRSIGNHRHTSAFTIELAWSRCTTSGLFRSPTAGKAWSSYHESPASRLIWLSMGRIFCIVPLSTAKSQIVCRAVFDRTRTGPSDSAEQGVRLSPAARLAGRVQIPPRVTSCRAITLRWISLVPSPTIISGASRK